MNNSHDENTFTAQLDDRRDAELLPVVDLDRDPQTVGRELDEVCREVGFFQIIGHGIDTQIADPAWDTARRFFDLSLAEKLTVERPSASYPYGYIPMGMEALSKSLGSRGPGDLKEIFNIGPVDEPTHELIEGESDAYSPNLWPEMLPELRETWTAYYRSMLGLSGRLLSLFARGLDLPPAFFDDKIQRSTSALRAINYTAPDGDPQPGQLRAGAHTDYGILTILRQEPSAGGLEVRDENAGEWVGIPSIDGAFVVNIGDLMARWTNDRWNSTLHRVVNPPVTERAGSRRQSMPFFFNADFGAVIECLPTCVEPGEQPRYEPVVAGPHLLSKFAKTVG